MITLNLLPDIKKEYLRSQRVKRLFIVGAVLVTSAFVAVVILLSLFVFGAQNLHLNGVQGDIDEALENLQSQQDLSKVITIQKQLEALPDLHDERPAVDRLFGYLARVVPEDITLSQVEMQFEDSETAELNGAGPDPKAINTFVDTLKNASFTYSIDGVETTINPFSSVVLDSVGVEAEETSYSIILEYDPVLFDNRIEDGKLTVPKITSSTSVQERPVLFQELQSEEEEE